MAFVFLVEDGTGLELANAYVSTSFADDYHSGRGHSDWVGASGEKRDAIVRATDYVEKRFGRRFRGTRLQKIQGLEWPRLSASDNDDWDYTGVDIIPRQLQKAISEYALIALRLLQATSDTDLLPEAGVSEGQLKKLSEEVTAPGGGGVSESREYTSGSASRSIQSSAVSDTSIPEYPTADLWIEELLVNSSFRRVARA